MGRVVLLLDGLVGILVCTSVSGLVIKAFSALETSGVLFEFVKAGFSAGCCSTPPELSAGEVSHAAGSVQQWGLLSAINKD